MRAPSLAENTLLFPYASTCTDRNEKVVATEIFGDLDIRPGDALQHSLKMIVRDGCRAVTEDNSMIYQP